MVDKRLAEIGFKTLKPIPCIYIYSESGDIYSSTLHVDVPIAKNLKELAEIKQTLMRLFCIAGVRDMSLIWGWRFHDTARRRWLVLFRKAKSSL